MALYQETEVAGSCHQDQDPLRRQVEGRRQEDLHRSERDVCSHEATHDGRLSCHKRFSVAIS